MTGFQRLRLPFLALVAVGGLAAAAMLPAAVRAEEGGGAAFGTVTDPDTQKECSSCHMAYQAGMLPAQSWKTIMAGLKDHFGENATLDADVAGRIEAYLLANAADAGKNKSRLMRGVDPANPRLRISEMPWWIRAHSEEVSPKAFENPKVGSKANCVACHSGAAKGSFGD